MQIWGGAVSQRVGDKLLDKVISLDDCGALWCIGRVNSQYLSSGGSWVRIPL